MYTLERSTKHRVWSKSRSTVYVGDNITNLVDKFYSDNQLYSLKQKSKVWSSIGRKRNNLINEVLKKEFKTSKCHFSHKAGCSCGCSPGFILQEEEAFERFVDINFNEEVVSDFKNFLKIKQKEFDKEVASFK